jgi:hypothetical protein
MKPALLALLPLIFLAGCADTQPMPRNPDVARKIERTDGRAGDVPSINHPNLDGNRRGYYDDYYGGPTYDYYGRPYSPYRGHRRGTW